MSQEGMKNIANGVQSEVRFSYNDWQKWLPEDGEMIDGKIISGSEQVPIHWKDITQAFQNSCQELKPGELVHDQYFSLYEAMSAVELMDPKMDSGMIYRDCASPILSFEEAVEKNKVQVDNFSPSQLIGIVDELLACVASWLDGQPLVQTIFTCSYLHKVELIEDTYLKAYCVGILKSCDLIWSLIQSGQVFEEEDFCCPSHGCSLQTNVTNAKAFASLKEVDENCARNVKKSGRKPEEETDEQAKSKNLLYQALHTRIKFCRLFYSFFHHLLGTKMNEPFLDVVKASNNRLQSMYAMIPLIKDTCILGDQAEMNDCGNNCMMGFNPLICMKHLPSQFPKAIEIMERTKACDYIYTLIGRLLRATEVVEISNIDNIIQFFANFSCDNPDVLSRSALQHLFCETFKSCNDKKAMNEIIKKAIKIFTQPPILNNPSLKGSQRALEISEAFFERSDGPISRLLFTYCCNRSRQREKIGGLLEELSAMQEEASQCDEQLNVIMERIDSQLHHRPYLGLWGLYHTCKIMEYYLLLGFELDLYGTYEYYIVYWYVDYLYNHRLSCLYAADKHLQAHEAASLDFRKNKNKKSKKKKKVSEHTLEIQLVDAKQSMCKGYLRAIDGFVKQEKMAHQNSKYDNEKLRYEHRILPFMNVYSPQLITYEKFTEVREYTRAALATATEFYSSSAKFFNMAKTKLEEISKPNDDVTNLIKITKTNMVVMNLLASGHKKESKV
ncbi:uncharacterized protein TRIADDRAFT_60373 [Trichoplax adhaerens]|uniref:Protein MAK10 homolog n=1 Tax=Trichoplax adhaerens TaxID=10228 RepID=B3S817_TRIAD|nr:hypothetical protein TRIADDRAFT_60373 [Trichoplax adhaerens]EDV21028.1 hypothetical protein TRIADDRAFT_60373 [Trichoplax adhaerens]|eukprot:XP_002116358.1 hypothetical protein TRIADDRAFT_60373 [Trichoplax adhaerens]